MNRVSRPNAPAPRPAPAATPASQPPRNQGRAAASPRLDMFTYNPTVGPTAGANQDQQSGFDSMINDVYEELLGRSADGAGLSSFVELALALRAAGQTDEQIRETIVAQIKGSEEYAKSNAASSAPSAAGATAPSGDAVPGAEGAIAYAMNPGVNPNTGTEDWAYWCLALVNGAYGGGTDGLLRTASATEAYEAYAATGRVQQDSNPPRGALVWFEFKDANGVDWGHVGISLGDGTYVGTLTDGTNTGVRPIDGNLPYRGWSFP